MEIAEQVYEVETPSKKTIRSDANHDISFRLGNGGEAVSPNNPKKFCAGKRKTKV